MGAVDGQSVFLGLLEQFRYITPYCSGYTLKHFY